MEKKPAKLILIARVSDVEQRSALPAQELRLKAYAEKEELPYDLHSFDESAFSDVREEFAKLVADIKASKDFLWVVFDKSDRLSRNQSQEEIRVLRNLVAAGRIELHFPNDGGLIINRDSPAVEWFRFGMNLELAQYYSRTISDNVKRKFGQLLDEKCWPHRAPIGYLNHRISEKETSIIEDPVRAPFIRKAFELRALGLPYEVIAKQLADEGLRSVPGKEGQKRAGNKIIGKSYMEKIINDSFYYGVMVHGGKPYPHKYPPLITRSLFNACLDVKAIRSHDMTKTKSQWFTFKKLVKCGRCGRIVSSYYGRKNIYLRCSGTGLQSCQNPNTAEALLLDGITSELVASRIPEKFISQVIKELKSRHDDNQTYFSNSIAQLRKEYDGMKGKLDTLYRDRLDGRITAERYDELATNLERRQQDLNDQLVKLTSGNKSFLVSESYLLDLCQRAASLFDCSNYELRQQLLSFMFSNIELNDQKLSYKLNDPFRRVVKLNKLASKGSKSSFWQGRQDLNLRHPVLETGALPTELLP
jgi:site-specific DNA recombinase